MLCRLAGFWLALCVSPALLPCDRDAPPLRQDLWQQARCCTPVTIDTEQLALSRVMVRVHMLHHVTCMYPGKPTSLKCRSVMRLEVAASPAAAGALLSCCGQSCTW